MADEFDQAHAEMQRAHDIFDEAVSEGRTDGDVIVMLHVNHIKATLAKIDRDAKRAMRLESALILVIKQLSEELNEETPGWWGELIDMCKEALYGELT